MTLRFDGKVVVVTGAGNGIGKEYALFFASRGAKVVVNDLGGSAVGQGSSSKAADLVVEEIKSKGGVAVANYDSVEFGEKIIKTAVDSFGKVDILLNNAGILRDISFQKMKEEDWNLIFKVHVYGAYSCSKAAWNIMREQGYGRIVNTSSAAGLFGSFGQVNYSAAKLALHGFTQALAKEGEKRNIRVNTIAPLAASRMLETVMPPDILKLVNPALVVPLVAYLCHESCNENGSVFEVGGGFVAKLRWQRTQGAFFDPKAMTPESVAKEWSNITSFDRKNDYPLSGNDTFGRIVEEREKAKL
jgi:NAD(P)-dependent dehydrogenase (short-subunit alcohol dehydrogenase family)